MFFLYLSRDSRIYVASFPPPPFLLSRPINTTESGNIVRIWKMHSLRCSRWRHRWEGAKLSRLRFQRAAPAKRDGKGVAPSLSPSDQGDERRLYRAAWHVSFFLIIIFNPIHCTVQQFALTPTSEILQGFPSDEEVRRFVPPANTLSLASPFAFCRVL